MGLIELVAPRVEVGAVRLAGVATLVAAAYAAVATADTGNLFGIGSVAFLALAGLFFLTATPNDVLGARGVAAKALYFSLLLLAAVSWFAGV